MKYCADTWFILKLFKKDPKALAILNDAKDGKSRIIIPIMVYAEARKKLMQEGCSAAIIGQFFTGVEMSNKIGLMLIDKRIAEEASKISFSYSVPLIDSFVAATCKLTDCNILLADDCDYELLEKKRYLKVQRW
ncbi:PIN domain-containing protein [Candidatus Woesearchaeota archaeon]|nr:PIN domain-containing protein [Candidatus Woesearchaeota archaeon]